MQLERHPSSRPDFDLQRFTGKWRSLAVAVSGGGDSVALLHLLTPLARAQGIDLHILTVDHGTRASAKDETAFVERLANELGWSCQTLTLSLATPFSHNRARRARYAALASASRRTGARNLLTGHTLDDQIETLSMRLSSGSNAWGMAGIAPMAPFPIWPEGYNLGLVRPLLNVRRADLRQYLTSNNARWIDDPSNTNTEFERVRVREALAADQALQNRLLDIGRHAASLRRGLHIRLTHIAENDIEWLPGGSAVLKLDDLKEARSLIGPRLLQLLCLCISGREQAADLKRVEALYQRLSTVLTSDFVPETLGGCRITVEDGDCLITPETGPASLNLHQLSDTHAIWHGRVLVCGQNLKNSPLRIVPQGGQLVPTSATSYRELQRPVRQSLPRITGQGGDAYLPHLSRLAPITVEDLPKKRLFRLLNPLEAATS